MFARDIEIQGLRLHIYIYIFDQIFDFIGWMYSSSDLHNLHAHIDAHNGHMCLQNK
jgi:hypothetical protein